MPIPNNSLGFPVFHHKTAGKHAWPTSTLLELDQPDLLTHQGTYINHNWNPCLLVNLTFFNTIRIDLDVVQIFTQCFILFDHMSMHWLTSCGAQASCPAVQQSRRPPWRLSSSAYSTRSKLLLGGFNPCHTSNISSAAGCSAYHIPYKYSYRVYIGYTLHIIIIVHMKSGYIWLRSAILRLSIVSLTGCFWS